MNLVDEAIAERMNLCAASLHRVKMNCMHAGPHGSEKRAWCGRHASRRLRQAWNAAVTAFWRLAATGLSSVKCSRVACARWHFRSADMAHRSRRIIRSAACRRRTGMRGRRDMFELRRPR